ncbi:hypothetical protein BDQ17DRAFT_1340706 [Cyathus striatus]|nr:hypothetical protein BDQ17DRAFT_1340706 [Cyathus striatus]
MDNQQSYRPAPLSFTPDVRHPPFPTQQPTHYSSPFDPPPHAWLSPSSQQLRSSSSTPTRDSYRRPSSVTRSSSKPDPKINIIHPYARLFAKKDDVKRRKIWNHALEKSLFSPYELSTVGAPQRRRIYISSLEAHIDQLHNQLLGMGYWPVQFSALEPFKGLNSKTAKSMVAGLQYDASIAKLKLLELERANHDLEKLLHGQQ